MSLSAMNPTSLPSSSSRFAAPACAEVMAKSTSRTSASCDTLAQASPVRMTSRPRR